MGGQRHAPAALFPGKRPGTHCIGGWLGPKVGAGRVRKITPLLGFDPRAFHMVLLYVLYQCVCWFCCVNPYCPFTCQPITVPKVPRCIQSDSELLGGTTSSECGKPFGSVSTAARCTFVYSYVTQRKVHAHYILFVLKLNFVPLIPHPSRSLAGPLLHSERN